MQEYLNLTSDIQTAALVFAQVKSFPETMHERVNEWIKMYRDYLNKIEEYFVRAKFDVSRGMIFCGALMT